MIFHRFSLIFTLSPLIFTANIPYSDPLTRNKLIYAAISAYSSDPRPCLSQGFPDATVPRQVTVACDKLANDTCSGFIGVSRLEKAILVVFRGTTSNEQLEEEAKETVLENHTPWPAGGVVSGYFYNGFMKLWAGGMKDDFNSMRAKYPGYQVWVLGHSLGGAMASLAASYISYFTLAPSESLLLTTFGQPRTGNLTFANSVDTIVPNAYRVTHSNDPIPQLPGKGHHGYYHFKSEVWYNKNSGGWVICNENEGERCSDQVKAADYDFEDHLHYFNLDILGLGYSNCRNLTVSTENQK